MIYLGNFNSPSFIQMQKDDPDAEKAMSMKKRGELGWIRGVLVRSA